MKENFKDKVRDWGWVLQGLCVRTKAVVIYSISCLKILSKVAREAVAKCSHQTVSFFIYPPELSLKSGVCNSHLFSFPPDTLQTLL